MAIKIATPHQMSEANITPGKSAIRQVVKSIFVPGITGPGTRWYVPTLLPLQIKL